MDPRNSKLENWKAGIDHFNSGQYWEAHEAWERDWLSLPVAEKLHIQILIQVAGVLYLIEKRRLRGAHSLLKTALSKMDRLQELGGVSELYPRVEIADLQKGLLELAPRIEPTGEPGLSEPPKFARARLLLCRP